MACGKKMMDDTTFEMAEKMREMCRLKGMSSSS
jgi:hypothetical protein